MNNRVYIIYRRHHAYLQVVNYSLFIYINILNILLTFQKQLPIISNYFEREGYMPTKIKNYFNPENNHKIWLAGLLEITDSLFIKNMRNCNNSLKQGVVCKTQDDAEKLNEFLKLCSKIWQYATYGAFANFEIINIAENLFNHYLEEYEQPVQGELFSIHPYVLDWHNHRDEINYDEYKEEYLRKALSGFSENSKKKWGRKLGFKL